MANTIEQQTLSVEQARSKRAAGPRLQTSEPTVSERLQSLRLGELERGKVGDGMWTGRLLKWVIILALLGAAGYYGYPYYLERQVANQIPQIPVVTVRAQTPNEIIMTLSGYIDPKREVNVTPQVSGTIVAMPVEVGMRVKKGDLLVQIENANSNADYKQSKAAVEIAEIALKELQNGSRPEEVAQAQAALESAKLQEELVRNEVETLVKAGRAVPPVELESARTNFLKAQANVRSQQAQFELIEKGPRPERIESAKAQIEQAKATLERAKYYLDQSRLVAPADGTILELNAELGEIVRPESLVQALCRLADLSSMQVALDVQERDLHQLQIGDPCRIVPDAYPDRTYEGRIERFQPQVNRQRGSVEVRIEVLNPDELLLPQMNCRVDFLEEAVAEQTGDALWVPRNLISTENDASVVYVLEGNVARKRTVQTGETKDESIQVTEGLAAGDVVLVPGLAPIADGQPVRPKF